MWNNLKEDVLFDFVASPDVGGCDTPNERAVRCPVPERNFAREISFVAFTRGFIRLMVSGIDRQSLTPRVVRLAILNEESNVQSARRNLYLNVSNAITSEQAPSQ